MSSILQGTTPTLRVRINTEDLLVTDITALELTFRQLANAPQVKHLNDVTLDAEANRIIYHFTEEETLAFNYSKPLEWQLRIMTTDGEIAGTEIRQEDVSELMSHETLS